MRKCRLMLAPQPQEGWKRIRPVLLTTLVPLVAALGFFALATYAKKAPNVKDLPSMAAFDACLTANDLQPAQSYASPFDAQIASEQEMKVCGSKVPPEVIKKWQPNAEASSPGGGAPTPKPKTKSPAPVA